MLAACSAPSAHNAVLLSGVLHEAFHLQRRGGFAGAPFDAAVGHQVQRGDALGGAGRMVIVRRHQHDAVAKADVLGALRAGGEENLGRGGMRIFLQEVVLDLPDIFDAKLVGQFDLIQRLLIDAQFGPSSQGVGTWCS